MCSVRLYFGLVIKEYKTDFIVKILRIRRYEGVRNHRCSTILIVTIRTRIKARVFSEDTYTQAVECNSVVRKKSGHMYLDLNLFLT